MANGVAVENDGVSTWQKIQSVMAAAQGQMFVTLKVLLYSYGNAALVIIFSVALLSLFAWVSHLFGVAFSSDFVPAVEYYDGG